jgi:hypothetical protein
MFKLTEVQCSKQHDTAEHALKGQIRGFQIGPMSLENIPVVQRNKQKDFGVGGMFNYEVIQVCI